MEQLSNIKSFNALKISLASPEEILSWSHGEVTKPETINYRTFRCERDGLFDERIFGPVKDYECYCGKYKRIRYKGVVCDKCGVEVTTSRVRRERMGHIKLAAPVAHVWFFRGIPSKMGTLLEMSPRNLEAVIYFSSFIVVEYDARKKMQVLSRIEKEKEAKKKEILDKANEEIKNVEKEAKEKIKEKIKNLKEETEERKSLASEEIRLRYAKKIAKIRDSVVSKQEKVEKEYNILLRKVESVKRMTVMADTEYLDLSTYIDEFCKVGIGADAILEILKDLNLNELARNLRKRLERAKGQQFIKLIKRLRVVEGFRRAKIDPSWMILRVLPVIPPDLRPMVQLEGGRFATSDLNDLYRRVINRNNRLKRLLDLGAPEIIVRNEKRMLQEAVDALIDSSRQRRARPTRGKKELKSLSDMLKGKQGRFRQNLLGKRVDYSGRAVIVAGPNLRIYQCGLPKEMALELFKPFVLREILARGLAPNVKSARYVLEERSGAVWDILEEVATKRPVLLNRAPTLWRLGIQAFYPKLIDGNSIQLHPCVCPGFNADFDGDQMAVHVPLSKNAVKEAEEIIISSKNLFRPSDGSLISLPTKEILLGVYYLTSINKTIKPYEKIFSSKEEAALAHNKGLIKLRQKIKVEIGRKVLETSIGRIIFNDIFPESFPFINDVVAKSAKGGKVAIASVLESFLEKFGQEATAKLIDDIMVLGFTYATKSGVSTAINDCKDVKDRDKVLAEASERSGEIDRNYRRGLITKQESSSLHINLWLETTDKLDKLAWETLGEENPVKMVIDSGASKASRDQLKQISGMRGLVADPLGRLVKMPIRGNYKNGLSGFEYFASSRGSRKGLTDKALKTADAGYLTRRLVDVAQDVLIREEDCGVAEGRIVKSEDSTALASFAERLKGRFLAKDIKVGRKTLFKRGTLIDKDVALEIERNKISQVEIRSPLSCKTRYGVCAKCYGIDLMTRKVAEIGVPVGVAAAQSIGEPGTQLTLRTFHAGGIAGKDITQGLPRVEEIFEARTPRNVAVMSEISGRVKIIESDDKRYVTVKSSVRGGEIPEVTYEIDPVAEIIVEDGSKVSAGDPLTLGHLDLMELLSAVGVKGTQRYILNEIQKVYSSQGVSIDDKHIEVIIRQMFSKVQIENVGDTSFLPGKIVSKYAFEEENERVLAEGGTPAEATIVLLGITKASLETEGFLSAASFQETTRVLTDAAASGKIDRLLGLKENVIIGRMIPVGERAKLE